MMGMLTMMIAEIDAWSKLLNETMKPRKQSIRPMIGKLSQSTTLTEAEFMGFDVACPGENLSSNAPKPMKVAEIVKA